MTEHRIGTDTRKPPAPEDVIHSMPIDAAGTPLPPAGAANMTISMLTGQPVEGAPPPAPYNPLASPEERASRVSIPDPDRRPTAGWDDAVNIPTATAPTTPKGRTR